MYGSPCMKTVLAIGNKNYSSWSLRPWLALRWAGIAFEERLVQLGGEGYGQGKIAAALAVSPTGRVPSLDADGLTIWDSLAICEWANEQVQGALWPRDASKRAVARSVTAEMHSGFGAVRRDLSMNIRRRAKVTSLPNDTRGDIERITSLWARLRDEHGASGPWLFGERSIADAFFAPVVTRFRSYGIPLSETCAAYSSTLLADEAFLSWERDAVAEPWSIVQTDALWPGA